MRISRNSTKNGTIQQFLLCTLIIAVAISTAVQVVSAQTSGTGTLTGTVTDQSQAVIPGAQLKVTNQASGAEQTVVSTDRGVYIAPLLTPGTYSVEVMAKGFKTVVYPGLRRHRQIRHTAL